MSKELSKIKSKSNAHDVIKIIDKIIDNSYTIDSAEDLIDKLPFELKKDDSLEEQLIAIKDKIKKCNIINITIAVDYDMDFLEKLYDWFENNGFNNFLLDIKVDPTILGGLHVSHHGKFIDLSLTKKVSEYVKK